jgi:hypothetical protein
MSETVRNRDFEDILDVLHVACQRAGTNRVSVGDVMNIIGDRSFGPLLFVPGLIGLSPIGAIPGVPGVMAVIVMIVAGQILIGMDHAWLPNGIARRSIEAPRLRRAVEVIHPYARYVDMLLRRRLTLLTEGVFFYVLAALCFLVAIVTPIIELVPIAGIVPNAAICAYALAITAHDGLWALVAFLLSGACVYMIMMAV